MFTNCIHKKVIFLNQILVWEANAYKDACFYIGGEPFHILLNKIPEIMRIDLKVFKTSGSIASGHCIYTPIEFASGDI